MSDELKWWEGIDGVIPSDLPPDVIDPIRYAHYNAMSEGLDNLFADIHADMMEYLKHEYVKRNGTGLIEDHTFMGLGMVSEAKMKNILVDMVAHRAYQLHSKHASSVYIPKYRVGDRILEGSTRRVFTVEMTPRSMAPDKNDDYVYLLKDEASGTNVTRPASSVECTAYTRYSGQPIDNMLPLDHGHCHSPLPKCTNHPRCGCTHPCNCHSHAHHHHHPRMSMSSECVTRPRGYMHAAWCMVYNGGSCTCSHDHC